MARPKANDEQEPTVPQVDIRVIERRLAAPFTTTDAPIRLKVDEPHYVRWVNGEVTGRIHKVLTQLGYVGVPMHLLADRNEVNGLVDLGDGLVRRGERGKELLVMMPMKYHEKIEAAKAAARAKRRSPQAKREELAQALATSGDGWQGSGEAADAMMGTHPIVNFVGTTQEYKVRESE